MNTDLNNFMGRGKNNVIFKKIVEYAPVDIFLLLDSEFARRNLSRKFSVKARVLSASIEKRNYSFFCKLDSTMEEVAPKELIGNYSKPMIITGMGLYGEMFIKEIRLLEKIKNIPDERRAPIVIFGSPRPEKLDKIRGLFDLFIDNTVENSIEVLERLIESSVSE
ncbi:MAG TPA: hypothetical protein PK385_04290 [Spirochaetota bacterium]|jgi:hypothetical protein|nr:MAG: hypothetical protein BWX91_01992 [Spirochaetes bacterium ADurb.Bin133]HNZ25914.1 hypothetical protein [Spirochaetota bacterium]HOF00050.1 hypothetical protein [Spirochaetota bacterium]HOS31972.1 hypothetical protein [Spirochaetota bacterium]HOS55258.1 hypothetical protein [Spirochaetota bacterium]